MGVFQPNAKRKPPVEVFFLKSVFEADKTRKTTTI